MICLPNLAGTKDGDEVPDLWLLLLSAVGGRILAISGGLVSLGGIGIVVGIVGGRRAIISAVDGIGRSLVCILVVVASSGNGAVGGGDLLGSPGDLSSISAGSGSDGGDHGFFVGGGVLLELAGRVVRIMNSRHLAHRCVATSSAHASLAVKVE